MALLNARYREQIDNVREMLRRVFFQITFQSKTRKQFRIWNVHSLLVDPAAKWTSFVGSLFFR